MKIKIGVIFGGNSVEHEVSIISALQAMENIDEEKYEIVPIYITKDGTWYTGASLRDLDTYKYFENMKKFAKEVCLCKKEDRVVLQKTKGLMNKEVDYIDVAFPVVHGKGVEDGSLAGYLQMLNIPIVGPDVLGASIGQDKVILKQILNSCNIKTPKYVWFYENEYEKNKENIIEKIETLNYPVIIKPANLGSTIGITIAHNKEELEKAITKALEYEEKIIAEEVVPNLLELNCAVLGGHDYVETSAIAEMKTKHELLTFEDKYLSGGKKIGGAKGMQSGDFKVPAKLEESLENEIYKVAKQTFRALNLKGVCRIDFLVNKETNEVYVNEPNTIPGSLAFYLFKPKGKSYLTLTDELIKMAIKDFKEKQRKTSNFKSNILTNYNAAKGFKKGIK